jgi:hypothetical protein
VRDAAAAEELRARWPGRLVFSVGCELTLSMRGIISGRTYGKRTHVPVLREVLRSGTHNGPRLEPLLAYGKPVVVTEFGFRTYTGADRSGTEVPPNMDPVTMALHLLPLTRRLVQPQVKTLQERDEDLQARSLLRQLALLDTAGVNGAFDLGVGDYPKRSADGEAGVPGGGYRGSHESCWFYALGVGLALRQHRPRQHCQIVSMPSLSG